MVRLDSHNMDDRELTVKQRIFLTLRKEKGLTLSCTMGRVGAILLTLFFNIGHGKRAYPKGVKFLEYSYKSIDKRTNTKIEFFGGVYPTLLAPRRGCCPKMATSDCL